MLLVPAAVVAVGALVAIAYLAACLVHPAFQAFPAFVACPVAAVVAWLAAASTPYLDLQAFLAYLASQASQAYQASADTCAAALDSQAFADKASLAACLEASHNRAADNIRKGNLEAFAAVVAAVRSPDPDRA